MRSRSSSGCKVRRQRRRLSERRAPGGKRPPAWRQRRPITIAIAHPSAASTSSEASERCESTPASSSSGPQRQVRRAAQRPLPWRRIAPASGRRPLRRLVRGSSLQRCDPWGGATWELFVVALSRLEYDLGTPPSQEAAKRVKASLLLKPVKPAASPFRQAADDVVRRARRGAGRGSRAPLHAPD